MKRALLLLVPFLVAGCLVKPVANTGGAGGVTVSNTNVDAVIGAAQTAFAQYGYTQGPANYPQSISFDKPAGSFGNLMFGSYNQSVTIRAKLVMTPLPGTNDIRLSVRVSRVTSAGEAGFEDSTRMAGFWAGQFKPILRQIQSNAGGAGTGSPSSL